MVSSCVTSFDAALMSPGDPYHLLKYEGTTQPQLDGGMHWNLHNNLWYVPCDGLRRVSSRPRHVVLRCSLKRV